MREAFRFYIGIDWATQSHRICVMNSDGTVLRQETVAHSGEGINGFLRSLDALTGKEPHRVAVAIEVPRGSVVEVFLERNHTVFAINPKQLDRFRDRYSVAGAKDDRRDAFVLADSLRTDQHCFRRLTLDSPDIVHIRELSRTEENLAGDLRRAANQLYQLLLRYYPQTLDLCTFPDEPWLWALLELAPTPERGAKLTTIRLRTLLAKYRIRRWTAEEVRKILTQPPLPIAPGVDKALHEHVLLLLPQLRLFHQQRKLTTERIQALLERMSASESQPLASHSYSDAALLLSIPGVGRLISATLLAEGSDPLVQRDYHALRAHAGIAPVTRQSGKSRQVVMRYGCNQRLRNAFYHWARTSLQNDDRSREHYTQLRHAGHGHGRALRGIADRLLAMLIAILKTGQPYDPARRLKVPANANIPTFMPPQPNGQPSTC
jgi:transposase